ncbi:hypothetical protein [Arthrobacter sp. UNC362MFTsu5.1]|uniref:hypothetical protein n=1 Tax=Arthrobacter sp. UNC362MFTsu5.1 TaxID=1449044 RepID=UPI0012DDCEF0|nr:hypothetical protein [Arthrobacter sp. UNC362MFTsu5.1]
MTHRDQKTDHSPALPRHAQLEPVLDWTKLDQQDELELVRRNGKTLTSGSVDTLASDGSVFWLNQDNGKGRAMFMADEDVIVFRRICTDPVREHCPTSV